MARVFTFLSLILLLTGCELFPTRNAERNAQLYQAVLVELRSLEAQGLIDPNTASAVLISRYGTSFGGTIALEGRDGTGRPMGAEAMTEACLNQTGSLVTGVIKRCLRQNYASADSLEYSHAGIAYRLPGKEWRVRQSLRAIETAVHFQWFGSLRQFIDIPLVEYRVEIIVPDLALQNRLAQGLLVDRAGERLIDPVYNLVSKPFQTEEQMSNQFVLELVASAMQGPSTPISRTNAQRFLRANGYSATVILLGGFQSLTKWDQFFGTIDLSDQPYAKRYEVGELITVLSARKFMQAMGRVRAVREVKLEQNKGP